MQLKQYGACHLLFILVLLISPFFSQLQPHYGPLFLTTCHDVITSFPFHTLSLSRPLIPFLLFNLMEDQRIHSRSMFRSIQWAASQGISPHRLLLLLFVVFPGGAAQSGAESAQTAYGLGSNINPSMGIIIIVLVCAFFFMGFFSIYIRQCVETRAAGGVDASTLGQPRRRTQYGGVDAAVIDALPVFLYSDVKFLKIGKGALECAVCLNEFEDDETLRLLPKCDHVFHSECIDAWFLGHVTCPVCRSNLTQESTEFITNRASINQTPRPNNEFDSETGRSETTGLQNQVSIDIRDDKSIDLQFLEPKQARVAGKFSRSHSTGHLVQPGENSFERFTLRLPEEVRRQIVNGKLKRTKSCTILQRYGSCRRNYRYGGGGEEDVGGSSSSRGKSYRYVQFGFGRSGRVEKMDRWVVSLTPPFFLRAGSSRFPKGGDVAPGFKAVI